MRDKRFEFAQKLHVNTEVIAAPAYSYWKTVAAQFFGRKGMPVLLAVVLSVALASFLQPLLSGFSPLDPPHINDPNMRFLGISRQFPFGTDDVGNSVWDVVWAGTRTSLIIGFLVTGINGIIGISMGAVWGFSKKLDAVMLEIYNVVNSVPDILIVTVLMFMMGPGFWQLIFAMCITGWMSGAYFIRTQVMMIRDREYNLVSRTLGTPTYKMVTRNVLPYLVSVIVTIVAGQIPAAISMEVMLSYLGIGLSPETASLGKMISKYSSYFSGYPHLFWAPVLMMAVVTVSLYLMGQAIADASDPKKHR